jgi:hypothetical protein
MAKERNNEMKFIEPEKTNQNGYIERFYKICHKKVVDLYSINHLQEVKTRHKLDCRYTTAKNLIV